MSTRSRANPWFRPVVPIAKAHVELAVMDQETEDALYHDMGRAMTRTIVRSRLSSKLVLQARLLDPTFDEECRRICPELPPLDPVATAELSASLKDLHA